MQSPIKGVKCPLVLPVESMSSCVQTVVRCQVLSTDPSAASFAHRYKVMEMFRHAYDSYMVRRLPVDTHIPIKMLGT